MPTGMFSVYCHNGLNMMKWPCWGGGGEADREHLVCVFKTNKHFCITTYVPHSCCSIQNELWWPEGVIQFVFKCSFATL